MTEQELLADPYFLGFCDAWQRNEQCPEPLIDWFLDRDLERMAESARWCHETWRESVWNSEYSGYICPHPGPYRDSFILRRYRASVLFGSDADAVCAKFQYANDLRIFNSFPEAIAWLLVNFDHEAAFARTSEGEVTA